MKGRVIAVVLVLALAVAASVVMAQGPRRGAAATDSAPAFPAGPGGPGVCGMGRGFGPGAVAALGLTDEQTAQLKQIRDDFLTATQTTRQQLAAECQKMADLWAAAQPDANAIKAQAAVIDGLRAELRNVGIDYAIAGLNVLTPEQREKLQNAIKEGKGRGPGMGFGCGMFCGPGPAGGKGARGAGAGMGPQDGSGPRGGTPSCPNAR